MPTGKTQISSFRCRLLSIPAPNIRSERRWDPDDLLDHRGLREVTNSGSTNLQPLHMLLGTGFLCGILRPPAWLVTNTVSDAPDNLFFNIQLQRTSANTVLSATA
jgi:hypothetical protein